MEYDFSKFDVGSEVSGYVIGITDVDVLDYTRGKYLMIKFTDGFGVNTAKKWNFNACSDLLPVKGEVYKVNGTVKDYGGKYLEINDFQPAPKEFKDALTPCSPMELYEVEEIIKTYTDAICDFSIKSFTEFVLDKYKDSFYEVPAAVGVHHNFKGGLALHSLEVLTLATSIASSTGKPYNYDLLVMGALLHDIGKVECYCIENFAPNMTLAGKLNDHIVVGIGMLYNLISAWISVNNYSKVPQWFDYLVHIIASHHENLEWGSPVKPAFEEALIVARADSMSASLTSMSKSIDEINTDDGFSKKRDFKFGTFLNKPYFRKGTDVDANK